MEIKILRNTIFPLIVACRVWNHDSLTHGSMHFVETMVTGVNEKNTFTVFITCKHTMQYNKFINKMNAYNWVNYESRYLQLLLCCSGNILKHAIDTDSCLTSCSDQVQNQSQTELSSLLLISTSVKVSKIFNFRWIISQ